MSARITLLTALVLAAHFNVATATGHPPIPEAGKAFMAPLATEAMILDAVSVDGRMYAVGERGIILRSDDQGVTWEQLPVPTRATLTGVHFHDLDLGWAVGHDAVILGTSDGGNTWELLYEDPEDQRPLFDVYFTDESTGYAIGAYGVFMQTDDGGTTWSSTELIPERWEEVTGAAEPGAEADETELADDMEDADAVEDEFAWEDDEFYDFHLNHIVPADDGRLYIAAESGNFFRSDDGGATWVSMPTIYEGSFFGVIPLEGDALLLMGLRGNLFRSEDGGVTWEEIPLPVVSLLNGGVVLEDGRVLIGGMAGVLLESNDGGTSFVLHRQPDRKAISRLLPAGEALVFAGEAGVMRRSEDSYLTGAEE